MQIHFQAELVSQTCAVGRKALFAGTLAPQRKCWLQQHWLVGYLTEKQFAAIMTCSDADENCPFIPGVELRLPLTYEDPKIADDTPEEAARYEERLRQIGREILYAFQLAFIKARGEK